MNDQTPETTLDNPSAASAPGTLVPEALSAPEETSTGEVGRLGNSPDNGTGNATNAARNSAEEAAEASKPGRNIERLLGVELDVVVRFGITNLPLREVVRMGVGTMVELNRTVDEPVELFVNNHLLARGEVVVVDGYYGVRITEISTSQERALNLL